MKKVLILSAMLPLLFSCGKDSDKNGGIPNLPATPQEQYAVKLEVPPSSGLQPAFDKLEFTGEGNYVLERKKSNGQVTIVTGVYVVEDQGGEEVIYEFRDRDGHAVLPRNPQPGEIDMSFNMNGSTYRGTAVVGERLRPSLFVNATCRIWSIEDIDIRVRGADSFSFGKVYRGSSDFHQIAVDLNAQGLNLNPGKFEGYTVKTIEFTTNGSFKIEFTGVSPYYGAIDGFNTDGRFNYTFDGSDVGNDFINGSSKGMFFFELNGKPHLSLVSKIKDEKDGKVYDCDLDLTLKVGGEPSGSQEFAMDIAIDGYFSEWEALTAETADGEYYLYDENTNADRPGILRLKLASDEDYIYVYTELLYDNIYLAEGGPFKQGGSWTGFLDNHPGTPGALIVYVDGDNKSDGAFAARAIGNEESMWDYTGFDAFPQLYFCWDVAANRMQLGWQQNNWPQNHDSAWDYPEEMRGEPLTDHGVGWWGDDTDGTPVSDNTVCDENTCKFSGIVKVKDPVSKADVSVIKMEFAMDREAINEYGPKVNTQTVIGIFYEQIGHDPAQTSDEGSGKLPSGKKALTLKLK